MIYTKNDIFEQLKAMGVPNDSVVTVHSSLRSVGLTEGRGEGFLNALIEYFKSGDGLLVIPTHTWANFFNGSEFNLDLMDFHTCIGTLPNLAANHKDAYRSEHPTHSVAVFGNEKKAEDFIRGDGFTETCTSPNGCYGKLYRNNGYVLLIGVGQNRNTYLHCVEEMLDINNRTSRKYSTLTVRRKDGSIFQNNLRFMEANGIGDVSTHFPKLEPAFRYYGCIKDGYIGDAKSMLCDAVAMKNVMELIYIRSGGRELMADDIPLDEKLYVKN